MNKLIPVILFIVSFVFATAQTDSTAHEQEVPLTSSLQMQIGLNQPLGNYAGKSKPFHQSFAAADGRQVNLSIQYGHVFRKNWEFTIGGVFVRNEFSGQKFYEVYLKTVGDTLDATNDFLYEHIGLHTGVKRLFKAGPFIMSAGAAIGGLYTLYVNRQEDGIGINVKHGSTSNTYKGGTMRVGKSLRPMVIGEVCVKYDIGYDTYILLAATYIRSSYKLSITERDRSGEHPYITRNYMPISTMAYSFGICTMF